MNEFGLLFGEKTCRTGAQERVFAAADKTLPEPARQVRLARERTWIYGAAGGEMLSNECCDLRFAEQWHEMPVLRERQKLRELRHERKQFVRFKISERACMDGTTVRYPTVRSG